MSDSARYLVRQYRPAYFSGFDTEVYKGVSFDEITKVPFCANFKQHNFDHFTVEPYAGGEYIISAKYKNGESWVVGFAIDENSKETTRNYDGDELMVNNWRDKDAKELPK